MTQRWLSVLGIGDDGYDGLSALAKTRLSDADLIVGGDRHLAFLPEGLGPCEPWTSPLSLMIDRLSEWRGRRVVVLATGDPMWFGIGATLRRTFSVDEMEIVPAPSAFALAASRLGWSLDGCEALTLHGRALEHLNARLYPGARLLILTADEHTPGAVAERLTELGYGEAMLTVLDHMGGTEEHVQSGRADGFSCKVTSFNTLAVACPSDVPFHSRLAGLPDDAFVHDGKMTKREVRAATLSRLNPYPGAMLWDIGAGCGSVAIEWMRGAHRTSATAIEPLEARRTMMRTNANALGVPGLEVIAGRAPDCLDGLPVPDAIFIGGGLSCDLVSVCLGRLRPGGVLVANAVTLESEAVLLDCFSRFGGELSRLAVSRAHPVGPFHGWKPFMPVTQWSFTRSSSEQPETSE